MPAGSRGPVGYKDYQRLVNYDGPALYSLRKVHIVKATEKSGALEVSRYLSVTGQLAGINFGDFQVTFTWFANEGLTEQIAQRRLWVTKEITQGLAYSIPNLGPWLQVSVFAEETTCSVEVYGSNRTVKNE